MADKDWTREWPIGREIEYLGRRLRLAAYESDPDFGCYAALLHYADSRGVLRSITIVPAALEAAAWSEAQRKRPEMFAPMQAIDGKSFQG